MFLNDTGESDSNGQNGQSDFEANLGFSSSPVGAVTGLLGALLGLRPPGQPVGPFTPQNRFDSSEPDGTRPGKPQGLDSAPRAHDWLYRGEPWAAYNRPVFDSDNYETFYRTRDDTSEGGSNAEDARPVSALSHTWTVPPESDGPARASSFMDPLTGKLDYWKWLSAGADRIGRGGDVLVDDSPDFMQRNGILNRPAAAIAAGNPENATPPRDVFVENGPENRTGGLVRQVALKAAENNPREAAPANGSQEGQPPAIEDDSGIHQEHSPPGQVNNQPSAEDGFVYRPWRDPKDAKMAQMIKWVADYHGLDPKVFQRLIQIESEYNPNKPSPKGAQGLGQLMPDTAKELEVKDPLDPFQNLMGAAKNLKNHLEATDGDLRKALWRYNAGQGNYYQGNLPQETRDYIQNITQEPMPPLFGLWVRPTTTDKQNPRRK